MARGLWHYLKDLPPIDWAYLASQRINPSKPGPQPKEWNRRKMAAQKANAKARTEAASAKRMAEILKEREKRRTRNLDALMLNAMEPGQWYGRPDITAASGAKRNSVHARLSRWEREGWIERAENVDWTPTVYRKGLGIQFQARGRAPRYLFKLTRLGCRERRQRAYMA
jgi:hypothetical protein